METESRSTCVLETDVIRDVQLSLSWYYLWIDEGILKNYWGLALIVKGVLVKV